VFNKDSSRVGPREWVQIAKILDKYRWVVHCVTWPKPGLTLSLRRLQPQYHMVSHVDSQRNKCQDVLTAGLLLCAVLSLTRYLRATVVLCTIMPYCGVLSCLADAGTPMTPS
jgi:hypothetical protein